MDFPIRILMVISTFFALPSRFVGGTSFYSGLSSLSKHSSAKILDHENTLRSTRSVTRIQAASHIDVAQARGSTGSIFLGVASLPNVYALHICKLGKLRNLGKFSSLFVDRNTRSVLRKRISMANPADSAAEPASAKSVHEFTVKDIDGEDVELSIYKGKVLLIVNVASACGLTNTNYVELTDMHARYKEAGLEILGFPCNQFGHQESGSNEQIKDFACDRFGVKFPMFDKIVVNGQNAAPLYRFLKASKGGGILGDDVKWNFTKFLVDHDGFVVNRYAATTNPYKIEEDIKKVLEALKQQQQQIPVETDK